jgi:hypothetical protein
MWVAGVLGFTVSVALAVGSAPGHVSAGAVSLDSQTLPLVAAANTSAQSPSPRARGRALRIILKGKVNRAKIKLIGKTGRAKGVRRVVRVSSKRTLVRGLPPGKYKVLPRMVRLGSKPYAGRSTPGKVVVRKGRISKVRVRYTRAKTSAARPNLPSTWQPWEWNGWEKFPSLYLAAEPEGYMSADQMKKISKFSLAILEFRTGQWAEEETTGRWAGGDLAGFMERQAERIKRAHPQGPPVLTYRSGMWAGSMFKKDRKYLRRQSQFIKDKRHCRGFIEYPMDVDESGYESDLDFCRWDFRKPKARSSYVSMVKSAAKENTNGVFFDNAQSVPCDNDRHVSRMNRAQRAKFMKKSLRTYKNAFSALVKKGKYPILSTTNRFAGIGPLVPWESDCPQPEEATIRALQGVPFARNNEFWMWNLGETAANQIRNSIRETENGIPIIVHMPFFPHDGGCADGCETLDDKTKRFTQEEFLEFGMAAFLVSMGKGSYFGFSDMQSDPEGGAGWFDQSWAYHQRYDNIQTGRPLGPVRVSNNGMIFTRTFENGTVWVNAANGTADIALQ